MTFVLPAPLNTPALIFVPQNEDALLQAVQNVATPRQLRDLAIDVEKSLISIRHKLSIAMYQAALIHSINANDLDSFEEYAKKAEKPPHPARIEYKGCLYTIEDIEHYRLMAMFFVETFAATCFSLLDVCGHFLNDMYNLELTAKKVDFIRVYEKFGIRKPINDPILLLLSNYILEQPHPVSWLKPLKELRNRTTHRPITDVCDIHTSKRRRLLYAQLVSQNTELLLNEDLFSPPNPSQRLGDFSKQIFDDLQTFVANLYLFVLQDVKNQAILPLS